MSHSAEVARRRFGETDEGFSLVEVLVALGVLMVVVTAMLPQLVVSIRSTGTARLVTQAKGIAQGELERMRNLPYHISPAAGDFRDVLDYYYTDLQPGSTPTCTVAGGGYAVPQPNWAGYVSGTTPRCSYEPPVGIAFYRTVREVPATTGTVPFTVVVNTRFLSGSTPPQPVTPRAGYDTQSAAGARPASPQIGVTATVLYSQRATVRPVSSYTQIADRPTTTTRVKAEASVTTLDVGSVTTASGPVSLSSGLLNLAGALTYASTVSSTLSGTSASVATGEQASGASRTVAAPPSTTAGVLTAGSGSLATFGCDFACWEGTRLDLGASSADQGLPNAGTPASPMQALLTEKVSSGFSFGNSAAADYRPGLKLVPPLLRLDSSASPGASGTAAGCLPGTSGAQSYVTAAGYLRTTAADYLADPMAVEACGVARTSTISLFPTDFAPRGVVLVELRRATARCLVSGPAHTSSATFDYEAEVKYFDGSGYQSAGIVTPTSTTDPLAGVNLATTAVGGTKVLGDYVASWAMLTSGKVVKTQVAGVAEVQVPGVVTIASKPVRQHATITDGDPDSVVSMAIGALSCSAEDTRS